MRRWMVVLMLLPLLLGAQSLAIYGYFEPQVTVLNIDNTFYTASNKLRIDIARDTEHISFGANVNYITYHGKTQWNVLNFLPDHLTDSIPAAFAELYQFHYGDMVQHVGSTIQHRSDRIFLDNAYATLHYGPVNLTVGRQQLSMGTGYTWNPTDLFNTKDVLDPTYEQPGHNAVRLNGFFGPFGIKAIWAPGEQWDDSAKLLKLKSRLGHFDLSLLAAQRHWTLDAFDPFSATAPTTFRRTLLGGDLVGELFGIGVWAEGGYNDIKAITGPGFDGIESFWEGIVGIDYTFENSLYVMAEYYYNSTLPDDWRHYTLNHWLWMLTAEMKSLSRQQLSVLAQYPATDLISVGVMSLASISDQSVALVPTVQWSLFQDVDLDLFGYWYIGKTGRVYAANMGNGGMARLRVYF